MNQHRIFADICPLLYRHLCDLKGDEKEFFRDLVNKPYQGIDAASLMCSYGDLRGHLSVLRHSGAVDLKTYFSMVHEANRLYIPLGFCGYLV